MAMAKAWPEGLDAVAEVLVATGRDEADDYLWAAIGYLSSLLPEADPDAVAWTSLVRGRSGIGTVTRASFRHGGKPPLQEPRTGRAACSRRTGRTA